MRAWAEVCESPHLKDLPYKIETNRYGKILMSPSYLWDGGHRVRISRLLGDLMSGGEVFTECAVDTTDGTRVADVAWISQERLAPYKEVLSLPIGPEICVEILSKSNTREEMQGKMQLYFAEGTREVWLCDKSGELEFYAFDLVGPISRSRLCPEFPLKLNLG